VLDAVGGPLRGNRKPQPKSWMDYGIGRSKFNLGAAMNVQQRHVRAQLYIKGALAKTFFGLLKNQKAEIERELDHPLAWDEAPDEQDRRIVCYLNDVDLGDRNDWPHQHKWLAKWLNEMHRVFAPRVRALEAD
jgi:Domain of unknown function (DUF4268)